MYLFIIKLNKKQPFQKKPLNINRFEQEINLMKKYDYKCSINFSDKIKET